MTWWVIAALIWAGVVVVAWLIVAGGSSRP